MRYKLYSQMYNNSKEILEIYKELEYFKIYMTNDTLFIKLKSLNELEKLGNYLEYPIIIGNCVEDGTGRYVEICDISSIKVNKH